VIESHFFEWRVFPADGSRAELTAACAFVILMSLDHLRKASHIRLEKKVVGFSCCRLRFRHFLIVIAMA
jgi:hypothetical protein